MIPWCALTSRALLALHGCEAVSFLQGLVTQDLRDLEGGNLGKHGKPSLAVFSAILTPQGRFFSDFFVYPTPGGLLLDCAKDHLEALIRLLQPYAMLHQVSLHPVPSYAVCAALGPEALELQDKGLLYPKIQSRYRETFSKEGDNSYGFGREGALFFKDPRHPHMGLRAWVPYVMWNELPHALCIPSRESTYHHHRMGLGMAEGAYDLVREQSIILEYGYQHMQAISWTKGCYMGQELMARTFHRGALRKHLYRVSLVEGSFPPVGSPLRSQEGSGIPTDQGPTSLNHGVESQQECPSPRRVGWMGGHGEKHGLAVLHETFVSEHDTQEPLGFYEEGKENPPFFMTIHSIKR